MDNALKTYYMPRKELLYGWRETKNCAQKSQIHSADYKNSSVDFVNYTADYKNRTVDLSFQCTVFNSSLHRYFYFSLHYSQHFYGESKQTARQQNACSSFLKDMQDWICAFCFQAFLTCGSCFFFIIKTLKTCCEYVNTSINLCF